MRTVIALLALVSGCYRDNPNYDGGDVVPDSDDTSGPACETSADCMGDAPVCDNLVCVQCTAVNQEACSPSLVCGDDNLCRNCESHDECLLSHACLASGQCAEADDVAYVAPNGVGLDCTFAEPCGTLIDAVDQGRSVIKLAAGRTDGTMQVRLTDRAIEVVADAGAEILAGEDSVIRLDGPAAGATVSDVTIIGEQVPISNITAAFSVTELGGTLALHRVTVHHHQGAAIRTSGGDVTVDRCNLVENTGGGVSLTNTRFMITSTLIVNNGATTSTFGGVEITRAQAGSKFAFNTVSQNGSNDVTRSGIDCTPPFDLKSSIVRGNAVTAMCMATYTLFVPPVPLPGGTGNVAGQSRFMEVDPMFYDQPTFYRIEDNSAASNVAQPDDDVTMDIDGDARAATPDMGADER